MIKPALVCIYTVGQVNGDDRFRTDRYHISRCEKIHMKHKAELKQGQIFLTLVRRIWALILLAVCLEEAGSQSVETKLNRLIEQSLNGGQRVAGQSCRSEKYMEPRPCVVSTRRCEHA
ncbi:hypothetical protein T4B_14913 [Trichinella pseudospiralis]|uniref:Uncharacterized protein n=2 Tax=Trichinella pseudospiralis TaxID=6337 RepID=A0A0V1G620_TRIPS|nr:hypothetical protein T4A_5467 [Trichinella pseudospiralis]KRY93647.1 hypothetical protein T4D_4325 [Trichinella pseudospiralis]KRZ31663.1 hypothetical protein T4B_14913 [Trichinella pseudospiralis]KRZ38164.1 hypothetical protein T4C_9273 [Trichinella pseudospiralis]